jgi:molybdopterin/thiamine biosynthesis adenylyltransferase
MNLIDPRRHAEVFSPHASGHWHIDVIGAGAVGSAIVLQLAKLGLEKIRVWDPDVVEPHNLANQRYLQADIGAFKVEALARAVKDATGHDIEIHRVKQSGRVVFGAG